MRYVTLFLALLLLFCVSALADEPAGPSKLDLRPRPQIVNEAGPGFVLTAETRIVLPKDWPPYVAAAARELAATLKASAGVEPAIVEQERLEPRRGDIVIGPHWVIPPEYIEPIDPGLIRPASDEGYNIRIDGKYCVVHGNSPRACFLGVQTLIGIARQRARTADGAPGLPGLSIADWPVHPWRTLQLHLAHVGSPYDRGEHVYRLVTSAEVMERSIRLAAYHKLTGLVIDVESGMTYDRHPENFTTGITRTTKADVRAAADLARSLGIPLVAKSNSSSGHDGWVIPYAYAVPSSDIYLEEMHDLYDEIIEALRPAYFHVGLDEDTFPNLDGLPLRDLTGHKRILLSNYEFLRRRGITMLVWSDGISQLGREAAEVPRDVIVLPWMYGGWDFTPAKQYIDQGFRILCAPWSGWHVENDQFFSIYGSTLKGDKMLGMAGTFWYPVGPDDNDYRRCLVKAADAFWNPLQAGDYPNAPSYYAPEYAGLPGDALAQRRPLPIPPDELPGLVALATKPSGDAFACEAARERLVVAGTAVVPALLDAMAQAPDAVSPWAEGTLRRIVRDPIGDVAPMTDALRKAAASSGALRALALEMLGRCGDVAFLEQQDASEPAVCLALGVSGDAQCLPALVAVASKAGPTQVAALNAIGRLRGLAELLSLAGAWRGFDDDAAREAYARALAMQGAESAIDVLGELAGDAEWRVRFRAAVGLGATQSPKAGPHILRLLGDDNPAVFRVALYWCTDTLILKPEDYFPALIARLRLDEDVEIVKPILHTLVLMWDPRAGQWLSRNEDPAKRLDYEHLSVWKDKELIAALNRMVAYKSARHATYALLVLMKMGAKPDVDTVVSAVERFPLEDKRWFCERMRDERRADMAPVFARLWASSDDHLVRTFILQYSGMVIVPETFEIAYNALDDIPKENELLRSMAVYAMAAHVAKLDDTAARAIPFILDLYETTTWPDGRRSLDNALCRAAGEVPPERLDNDPQAVAERLAHWRQWWAERPESRSQ